MKKLLFTATLLIMLLCACTSESEIKGGDGYAFVPGLSFGMSIEEALEVYPSLEYIAHIPDSSSMIGFHENLYDNMPKFMMMLRSTIYRLEYTEIYGVKSTVYLCFANDLYAKINDEDYTYDNGLSRVSFMFLEHEEPKFLQNMSKLVEEKTEEMYMVNSDLRMESKSNLKKLDDKTLEILRTYMANMPLIRESDGSQVFHDMTERFAMFTDNSSGFDYMWSLANGYYELADNALSLDGRHAALVYKARQAVR